MKCSLQLRDESDPERMPALLYYEGLSFPMRYVHSKQPRPRVTAFGIACSGGRVPTDFSGSFRGIGWHNGG